MVMDNLENVATNTNVESCRQNVKIFAAPIFSLKQWTYIQRMAKMVGVFFYLRA